MSSDRFSHNPRTLMHVAEQLRMRGISPVDVFRRIDVPPSQLLDEDRWITRSLCFALSGAAAAITGDRFFGAGVGANFRLVELGVLGRTIVDAATVAEACSSAARGIGLVHQGSSLRFEQLADHARLTFAYQGALKADPQQHLIATLAVLRKIALLGREPDAVCVQVSMPYARGADRLEEFFGSRLEFGCKRDAIVLNRDILDMPLRNAAEVNGNAAMAPVETAESVRPLLLQLLPYGQANLRTIAARLGVSKRTLQRRLKDWGFAFEEILDDLRRTEAIRHVLSGQYPLIEIAYLLGYSDPAHFTRAFRRWTGMPPREYARAFQPAMS